MVWREIAVDTWVNCRMRVYHWSTSTPVNGHWSGRHSWPLVMLLRAWYKYEPVSEFKNTTELVCLNRTPTFDRIHSAATISASWPTLPPACASGLNCEVWRYNVILLPRKLFIYNTALLFVCVSQLKPHWLFTWNYPSFSFALSFVWVYWPHKCTLRKCSKQEYGRVKRNSEVSS